MAAQGRAQKDEDYFFAEPGRIFSYSNPGYIVAGHAIEQLTGKLYADAMGEKLFRPLGMTRSTFRPTVALTFPLSQGHDVAVRLHAARRSDGRRVRPLAGWRRQA